MHMMLQVRKRPRRIDLFHGTSEEKPCEAGWRARPRTQGTDPQSLLGGSHVPNETQQLVLQRCHARHTAMRTSFAGDRKGRREDGM